MKQASPFSCVASPAGSECSMVMAELISAQMSTGEGWGGWAGRAVFSKAGCRVKPIEASAIFLSTKTFILIHTCIYACVNTEAQCSGPAGPFHHLRGLIPTGHWNGITLLQLVQVVRRAVVRRAVLDFGL